MSIFSTSTSGQSGTVRGNPHLVKPPPPPLSATEARSRREIALPVALPGRALALCIKIEDNEIDLREDKQVEIQ